MVLSYSNLIYIGLKSGYSVAMCIDDGESEEFSSTLSTFSHSSYDDNAGLMTLLVLTILSDFSVGLALTYTWVITCKRYFLMFITCLTQLFLGLIVLNIGNTTSINNDIGKHLNEKALRYFSNTGALNMTAGLFGISLCLIITENNRLSEVIKRFIYFIDAYSAIVIILTTVAFGLSVKELTLTDAKTEDLMVIICCLLGCSSILGIITIVSSRYFRKRQPPVFEVETLDLNLLSPKMKQAYASMIDRNSKFNSGVSGKAALDLMESYCNSPMDDMSCTVLRVFRPSESKNKSRQSNQSSENQNSNQNQRNRYNNRNNFDLDANNNNDEDDIHNNNENNNHHKHKKHSYESVGEQDHGKKHHTYETNFENCSVWDTLDEEKSIFTNDANWGSDQSTVIEMKSVTPMSKTKLKRMAKKAEKKKQAEELLALMEKNARENEELNELLESTEALVLLTSIENFDLTSTLRVKFGRFGQFLSDTFGKNSNSQLLCVRFGLLGFQWPFKRSTFYCSKTKKPYGRSAAVLFAISKWNSKRPPNEKCTLLLDPIYKSNITSTIINFGGWIEIHVPSSHIIDLRPYKGKSLNEYLTSIKYRPQNRQFDLANGKVIEHFDFNSEDCNTIIKMWMNIANMRISSGQTSTLSKPDAFFIQRLGKFGNENKDRSLLFLKVDDEIVASCVLFRLGDTITSDIQGLNHEISRKYKAYFVMMQEVIKIALAEGRSFVDFGPTTEKPKLDIGCQNVPLVGAMTASHALLQPVISISAKCVDV